MGRLTDTFETLKQRGEKALVTFITAGDPDLAATEELIGVLTEAGADIIELGVPFSDPMADGPTTLTYTHLDVYKRQVLSCHDLFPGAFFEAGGG